MLSLSSFLLKSPPAEVKLSTSMEISVTALSEGKFFVTIQPHKFCLTWQFTGSQSEIQSVDNVDLAESSPVSEVYQAEQIGGVCFISLIR